MNSAAKEDFILKARSRFGQAAGHELVAGLRQVETGPGQGRAWRAIWVGRANQDSRIYQLIRQRQEIPRVSAVVIGGVEDRGEAYLSQVAHARNRLGFALGLGQSGQGQAGDDGGRRDDEGENDCVGGLLGAVTDRKPTLRRAPANDKRGDRLIGRVNLLQKSGGHLTSRTSRL